MTAMLLMMMVVTKLAPSNNAGNAMDFHPLNVGSILSTLLA